MSFYGNPKLTKNAQALRRNMTKEERHLWYDFLKTLPIPIYRQKTFHHYILDFYCAKAKLIIEVDGSQHYDQQAIEYDNQRTSYLEDLGFKVLRYTNIDVTQQFAAVCESIDLETKNRYSEG